MWNFFCGCDNIFLLSISVFLHCSSVFDGTCIAVRVFVVLLRPLSPSTGDMGVGKSCLLHQFTEKKCKTCLHFSF